MGRVNLKVQSYQGHPVLTWWEGQIIKGTGEGKAIIADTSYRTIATINGGRRAAVTAQDTGGHVLGQSATVQIASG